MDKYVIALYIRLSRDKDISGSMSIENQQLLLRNYTKSLPEYKNSEVLEFTDNGYTGTNFERPAMQELLELVRQGKINCIIVKDMSRFGRNMTESGFLIEKVFPMFHVRFIAVNDYYDSNKLKGDTGGINVAFKYLTNELISRDTSMRIRSVQKSKMHRGEYQSKNCLYGYIKGEDGKLQPDKNTCHIVRQIFEWVKDDISISEIIVRLNMMKILTPSEYKLSQGMSLRGKNSKISCLWGRCYIKDMLSDERYTGTYISGKTEVIRVGSSKKRVKPESEWIKIPNHHEAIVSRELFELVNSKIKSVKQKKGKQRNYLLKGKLICGICGYALSKNARETFCCKYSKIPNLEHNINIKEKELEQLVLNTLKIQLKPLVVEELTKNSLSLQTVEQEKYKSDLSKIQAEKRSLYEKLISGEIDKDTYMEKRVLFNSKETQIKNIYLHIKNQVKQQTIKNELYTKQKAVLDDIITSDSLNQSLVDMLINKIIVYPDKKIEIVYKTKDFFVD